MMNLGMDTFLEYGLGGLELFVLLRYVLGFEYRGRKYIAGAVISAITLAALSPVLLKMGLLQVGSDYYIQKSSLLYFLGETAILLLVFRKLRVGHFLCLYEMQRIVITFLYTILYTIGGMLMKESLSTMMSELILILLIGILCDFSGKKRCCAEWAESNPVLPILDLYNPSRSPKLLSGSEWRHCADLAKRSV